jgi:hypothetical protein
MKTLFVLLIALLALLAAPVYGATVGSWKDGLAGDGNQNCPILRNPGTACAWTCAAGNAPMIGNFCPNGAAVSVTGTCSVKVHKCVDSTLGNCDQLETVNKRTGAYGVVTLDATDYYVLHSPFRLLTVEYVSGTGDAIIECGG